MAKKKTTKKKLSKLATELLATDFNALEDLSKEMSKMADTVERLPEDIEYTQADIGTLEEVRHYALKLARECEAAIKTFEGTAS